MILSAVVLSKNEAKNIVDCLKSLSFCDEVIVVDDDSTDNTANIAQKLGAKVYQRDLNSDFSSQRNFGLQKAGGKWVLFIDCDERVSKELAREIIQIVNDPLHSYKGFYMRRLDYMWGKLIKHGEVGGIKLLRLAYRDSGIWKRRIHEYWEIGGLTRLLKNPLFHYPHPTLAVFVSDISRMTTLHALANYEEGKYASIFKVIIWPFGHFIKNFILRRGYLDGNRGLVYALIMASHSYLAWSKLWMYQRGFRKI